MCHIEEYFTPDQPSLHSMWKAVLEEIVSKPSVEEQRIVVSTIAYTVYDLTTVKVKSYKTDLAATISTDPEPHEDLMIC